MRHLKAQKPLDIINGPLMKGMDEVGRLFNANQLIVAEVLQIAEVDEGRGGHPRAAHGKGRQRQPGQGAAGHGQGRRPRHRQEPGGDHPGQQRLPGGQPGDQGSAGADLIEAVREHKPDIIGLSRAAGEERPADGGHRRRPHAGRGSGAHAGGRRGALAATSSTSRSPRPTAGTVAYAQDAMSGLDLAKQIVDPRALRASSRMTRRQQRAKLQAPSPRQRPPGATASTRRSPKIEPC